MKRNSNNQKFTKVLIITVIIIFLFASYLFLSSDKKETTEEMPMPPVIEIIEEEIEEQEVNPLFSYIELYDTNKALNSDYAGQLVFESGLINEPFVYSKNNVDYLRRNFITGQYDEIGTIFMDYETNLDTQNIVLYGHYVYPQYDAGLDEFGIKIDTNTLMFTPLKYLANVDNYEENKNVYLVLENELREYQICAVYYLDLTVINDAKYPPFEGQYYLPEFSKEYFDTYKKFVESKKVYETGVDYNFNDRFLTLQTCVEGYKNSREIIVLKYVGTTKLDRNEYDSYKIKIN